MVGIIYANCVNMAIRGTMSIKISMDKLHEITNREEFTTGKLVFMVLMHKFFLGLCVLGVIGTAVAFKLLEFLLLKLRK